MRDIDDLRDFDKFLRGRSAEVRAKLRDLLAGRRLMLAQALESDIPGDINADLDRRLA